MADLRIPPSVPAAAPAPRPQAALAAQRAFFQAALQGQPAPTSVAPQPNADDQPATPRTPRPGSLLDIKV